MSERKPLYVVWVGRKPGIYDNKKKMLEQVIGFPGAVYTSRAFISVIQAEDAFNGDYNNYKSVVKPPKYLVTLDISESNV